jgi:hypothetical protein
MTAIKCVSNDPLRRTLPVSERGDYQSILVFPALRLREDSAQNLDLRLSINPICQAQFEDSSVAKETVKVGEQDRAPSA